MCFYYHLSKLAQRHDARALEPLNLIPGFVNGFQHPRQPVVTADRVTLMQWGLIPGWMKSNAKPFDNLNARQETVAEKPMFRDAVMHRRCIVPANGFLSGNIQGGKRSLGISRCGELMISHLPAFGSSGQILIHGN